MPTYCVFVRESAVSAARPSRTSRVYLDAATADLALLMAALENPDCRVFGIEPADYLRVSRDGSHAA